MNPTGTTEDNAVNRLKLTDAHVSFGQFLDHDIGLSPEAAPGKEPKPFFSPGNTRFREEIPIQVLDLYMLDLARISRRHRSVQC